MTHVRVMSVALMMGGVLMLGLSAASGLWARVESTLRPMKTEALFVTPTPTTQPRLAMTVTPAAALFPPTPDPLPNSTPMPHRGSQPVRLRIPALELDVPIVPVTPTVQTLAGVEVQTWPVPDTKAAGWMVGTAPLGSGNTVLNGHNASRGEVFRYLYRLDKGALIVVWDAEGEGYAYRVAEVMIVSERDVSPATRLENARFVLPSSDVRLTLITCHPYGSTRYRLIVIAFPDTELCLNGCS